MFPRCKRRIRPLDTALMLRAMIIASELGTTWSGDQEQQNTFAKLLDDYGLKSGGTLRDRNSGGSRTYEAQFRSLGLLYNNGEKLALTHAGEDLVALENTTQTLQRQILKYQYPSAYSLGRNVRIDPEIKVRPFTLLLRLAMDQDLNGLSDRDIMIPVVFGHNDTKLQECKDLILKARTIGIENVIPNTGLIRTTKTESNSYEKRLKDIKDIANTFKNVLQGVGLIDLKTAAGETRIHPRPGVMAMVDQTINQPFVDFKNKPEDQATLEYGKRYGAVKDTRRTFMPSCAPDLYTKESLILQRFKESVELPMSDSILRKFVNEMQKEFSMNPETIHEILKPVLLDSNKYALANLVELSRGGLQTAEAFERAIERIFESEFGYEAEWAGRRRAGPKRVGGYADIYVIETARNICGIIDTKSMETYDLPHADYAKMLHTYIPSVHEIYQSREERVQIGFIAYISHLIKPSAIGRAQSIYDKCSIPVALCSAYGINNMREDRNFYKDPSNVTTKLSEHSVVFLS